MDNDVIAVLRLSQSGQLARVAEAVRQGGVKVIEFAFTTPHVLGTLQEGAGQASDEILVGAGTVSDAETARVAILAGAQFIVGPRLNLQVVRLCQRYGKIVISGAITPPEILAAWENGAGIVKVFPATVGGPQDLR